MQDLIFLIKLQQIIVILVLANQNSFSQTVSIMLN